MFRLRSFWMSTVRAPDGGAGGVTDTAGAAAGAAGASGGSADAGAAAAQAGGAAPAAAPPAATAAAPKAFADSLPADLREAAVFKDIKDLDGLARSYANAAKMVGMDKARIVALPADGDDAAMAELFTKLGRPESADKYGFTPPEGVTVDAKLQEGFATKAHEVGLTTKQAQALYGWYNEQGAAAQAQLEAAATQRKAETTAALKTEWGTAYDQNILLAQKAVEHYGSPELRAELDKTGLGDAPHLIKVMAKLGRQLSEDGLIGRSEGGGEAINSPTEARQQINAKKADPEFMKAYVSKTHPKHAEAVTTMQRLYQQAYPEAA